LSRPEKCDDSLRDVAGPEQFQIAQPFGVDDIGVARRPLWSDLETACDADHNFAYLPAAAGIGVRIHEPTGPVSMSIPPVWRIDDVSGCFGVNKKIQDERSCGSAYRRKSRTTNTGSG